MKNFEDMRLSMLKKRLLQIFSLIILGYIAANDVTNYKDTFDASFYIIADSTGIISVQKNCEDITREYN